MPPSKAESHLSLVPQLTSREREVVALVAAGLSNAEIAERLGLVSGTISTYLSRILRQLGLRNRVQVAVWAVERGLRGGVDGTLSAHDSRGMGPITTSRWEIRADPDAVESLTRRELEVIRLLEAKLSNEEIAAVLRISSETVARHTSSIYQKLVVPQVLSSRAPEGGSSLRVLAATTPPHV